jgi:hypothetical protein
VTLDETVDRDLEQFGLRVGRAVPVDVVLRLTESKIGAEVQHGTSLFQESRNVPLAVPVRKR